MIITKSGRRMFPSLHIQIYDLDPLAHYCILLEMNPATHCRYKYSSSGGWAPAGTEEAQSPQRIYLHPDSPSTGEYWMSQPISFGRLKLTNTPSPPVGHMVLSSMHKYQPRIIITKTSHPRAIAWAPSSSVVFPETQFIAVTAYQNEKITKLKIDNNPFAKGFRENGQSKCKRKRTESEPVEDEKCSKQQKVESSIKALPPLTVEDDRLSPCSLSSPPSSPETSHRQSTYASSSPQHYSSYFYNHLFPQPTPAMYSYYPPYQFCSMWGVSHPFFHQYSFPIANRAEDLSVPQEPIKEKPRKLTDFSIKAITGCL